MATKTRSAALPRSLEASLKEVCAKLNTSSREKALRFALKAAKANLRERESGSRELSTALKALGSYRRRDPNYEKAIAAFVSAEAEHPDPAEGHLSTSDSPLRRSLSAALHG